MYALIFCLFSSDTLQVLMFVCPSISELRFYGCCQPCFIIDVVIIICSFYLQIIQYINFFGLNQIKLFNYNSNLCLRCTHTIYLVTRLFLLKFLHLLKLPRQTGKENFSFTTWPQHLLLHLHLLQPHQALLVGYYIFRESYFCQTVVLVFALLYPKQSCSDICGLRQR